jgi:hypothetical protein
MHGVIDMSDERVLSHSEARSKRQGAEARIAREFLEQFNAEEWAEGLAHQRAIDRFSFDPGARARRRAQPARKLPKPKVVLARAATAP